MGRALVIGSSNRDKATELRELLQGAGWIIKDLSDFAPVPVPLETGESFEANALLKARYYAGATGFPCVADDSGLEVDALGGAPGVYSARYAGESCTYDDNNRKLLSALAGLAPARRRARFVCCAAYADPAGVTHVERGEVEGRIAETIRGVNGFGYDPLFIPEGFDQTFGELGPSIKHQMSHRARAFQKLRDWLHRPA